MKRLLSIDDNGQGLDEILYLLRERGLARMRGEQAPSQYECKFVSKGGKELWAISPSGIASSKGNRRVL
jgi:hypothetical protein